MSNPELKIPEQDTVVLENRSQIVSASAGSGKTTVMIRKVVEHLKARDCHVDEVLILTYTTAAALEMKKKLIEKIKKELNGNEFLQDELDIVQTADICTIDSFCLKLVKKYFYILNIDPSFNILDSGDQIILQSRALEQAIQGLKEKNPHGYEDLISNLSSTRDEQIIKSIILKIYNYLTSVFDDKAFWQQTFDLYDKNLKIAENQLNEIYTNQLIEIKNKLNVLMQQSKDLEFDKYVININEANSAIDSFVLEKDFTIMVENADKVKLTTIRKLKADEQNLSGKISAAKKEFKDLRDELKNQFISRENIEKSYEYCRDLVECLKELYDLFVDSYNQQKSSQNTFDFNDIERLAIKLLENEQANQEIKNSYKKIFIDEFQDANRVQEKIIFLLDNNNLFFVGDTKQSIYGFRQSEPEIFLNIEKMFDAKDDACANKLNCNFRTNKNILEFANHVFCNIMTEESCGLDYTKAKFEPKAPYIDLDNEVCVDLNILLKSKEKQEKLPVTQVYSVKQNAQSEKLLSTDDYESAYICQKITEILGQDIYDKDAGTIKKIKFSDITILIDKRGGFLPTLLKHLKSVGIPYVVNVNDNLEECYDNQVLFNLLKLTLNFQDDYALYCVMNSYLFDFSDEELGAIKCENISEKYFYNCVKSYSQKNDKLAQKIVCFFDVLKDFSFEVKYKGIYFALNNIIKNSNYLLKLNTQDDSSERKLNIQAFINSFAGSKYDSDVAEYILYRETAVRQDKVQTNKSFTEAVEITTIHSSKGLEYPAVILPFLSNNYITKSTFDSFTKSFHSEININKNLGIGIKAYNDDDRKEMNGIFYNACKLKNNQQDVSERIRLLYVAMTRAKNKLIMIGTAKNEFKKIENVFSATKYLELIVGTLPQELIDKINNGEKYSCDLLNNPRIKFIVDSVDEITQEEKAENRVLLPNKNQLQIIENLSNYLQKSTNQPASNIALKNSVSEFAFDDDASHVFAPKTFNISEHMSVKSSEIGTLYHKVLEVCDFSQISSLEDLTVFITCNFADEEIEILKTNIGYENIYNSIVKIKKLLLGYDVVLKEQKFVMRAKHSQIVDGGEDCNILIQGIVDLMAVGKNDVLLLDFKYTKKDDEQIKQTYQKQLYLYELALSKRFADKKINKFIINLRKNTAINM